MDITPQFNHKEVQILQKFLRFYVRIRKYMDLTAKNIVGQSAYEFYHMDDMDVIQDAHAVCK